ncbi:MAG: prolyl-tRNA synthetase, partial [Candidatus Yonathbacteria bacterium]|nr:prolyl-tRNA synthetase [Candidatus Yonathbacteria bacterium]
SGKENALGPTHEEVVVPLAKQFISSYRDLPVAMFQIQNKFRMELRAKSGILRGREFLMKDLYSFHKDEEDLKRYYEIMKKAYKAIFERVGLGDKTHLTSAGGSSFSKYSHEFQTITPAGEDTIYLCEKCGTGINEEIKKDQETCPECGGKAFKKETSIEVGNIFELKTKFSQPFNLTFKNEEGKDELVLMGCYGIGLGRVMGAIVEVLSDEKGIVWPAAVAPFQVHIVQLGNEEDVKKQAEKLYQELQKNNIEVLYDDRNATAGAKFADADLMGIPYRLVVSGKTLKAGTIELKERTSGTVSMVSEKEILNMFKGTV